MIRAAIPLLIGVALGSPAAALSCLPHDLATTFERVNSASETYFALHGMLEFDASLLPEIDMNNQHATPPETRIPARISGEALGRIGFTRPFDGPVTLIVQCAGPWCAQPPAGGDVLAFVRQDAEGFTLTAGPCGGDAFFSPPADMLDKAHRCFTGGECTPELPQPQ
jgi:hypothetical protein